jgi:hypothetical protein
MPSNTIVLATFALAVVALVVHTRVKRGRRLLVLRDRSSALRWVLNAVLLAVAVLGLVASFRRSKGPWDSLGSLSLIVLALSDLGFDLRGAPRPGHCVFHENGILVFDGRRPVFLRWDEIERYEWQGETLMLHRVPQGLAHVGEVITMDVPPERRGDVMAVVAPRLRG